MNFDYIIFDFDGTLADTNRGIVRTFQATFAEMGIPDPGEAVITSTIGLILKEGFLKAVPSLSDADADRAVTIYRRLFEDIGVPATEAFTGIPEGLLALRGAGIRMSVASSRSHRSLERLAAKLGIDGCFETFCGAEDVVNHKPAPDMVNLIVGKYGLDTGRTLVVGDATYDLLMGRDAGCRTCGVTWGNQTRLQLSGAEPDYIIDDFRELGGIAGPDPMPDYFCGMG